VDDTKKRKFLTLLGLELDSSVVLPGNNAVVPVIYKHGQYVLTVARMESSRV
jgi:hypothetical protein